MHFIRLKSSEDRAYKRAIALYGASFPIHEQREPEIQKKILENDAYHFLLICQEDSMVGILLYWQARDFLYIEHFCIDPVLRGRQYGTKALELLHRQSRPVILEIDPPEDEMARRRKAFYERAGYQDNEFVHIHPPYREGFSGHRLVVMSYPERLTAAEYRQFDQYLKTTVMNGE